MPIIQCGNSGKNKCGVFPFILQFEFLKEIRYLLFVWWHIDGYDAGKDDVGIIEDLKAATNCYI